MEHGSRQRHRWIQLAISHGSLPRIGTHGARITAAAQVDPAGYLSWISSSDRNTWSTDHGSGTGGSSWLSLMDLFLGSEHMEHGSRQRHRWIQLAISHGSLPR